MLRRLLAFLVFGMSSVSITAVAVAQEDTEASAADQSTPETAEPVKEEAPPAVTPPPAKAQPVPMPLPEEKKEAKGALEGWTLETHGYFRAPMAIGISSRPNPGEFDRPDKAKNDPNGPQLPESQRCTKSSDYCIPDEASHLQLSYASPNRTIDWSYYSFAYTRLQEQDWAEVTFHAKRKHVDAAVGFMGYWLAAAGFRNPDAQQAPGIAYLSLDSDFELAGIKPNIKLTMGSWWPGYGYFEKYDTFTLGRFRHTGEQVKLTLPVTSDITVTLEQGFGLGRDGRFDYNTAQQQILYAYKVGANLVAYGNLRVEYQKLASLGLHYNYEFTRDPNMFNDMSANSGKAFPDAAKAHMSVMGGELKVDLPLYGRLWLSPSFISVKNGYQLAGLGGTEVMHAQGGMGVATNYLGWTNTPSDSTGTGTVLNVGGVYENSLSNILPDWGLPDVKISAFGLIARSSLDLPKTKGQYAPPSKINQYKWGADATVVPLTWLAIMARFDQVSLLNKGGYVFSAITGRVVFFSHFLSSESVYLQFSRYKYGDKMTLAGQVPWGANPLVAGADILQNQGYVGKKPDENIIKLQAQVTF